ncbi:hypothetical protein [Micromonospora sp. DT31]|uniref:hypothetical protein n=1 Tax=Micromonospora sp. DT31 TaxID=3393434 RepID=UPI003CF6C308
MSRTPPTPPPAHPLTGGAVLRWRHPALWCALAVHATVTTLLAVLDPQGAAWESPYAQVLAAALAVLPLAAALLVSVADQPAAGGAMAAGAVLMTPTAALGTLETLVAPGDHSHLAVVAAAGCLIGASGGMLLFGLIGAGRRHRADPPVGPSWARQWATCGAVVAVLLTATATGLAPERQEGRRLGAVVQVLSGRAEIAHPFWWWAAWAGVAGVVAFLVVFALAERRRQQEHTTGRRPPSRRP